MTNRCSVPSMPSLSVRAPWTLWSTTLASAIAGPLELTSMEEAKRQ
jgi:hypothetical protein